MECSTSSSGELCCARRARQLRPQQQERHIRRLATTRRCRSRGELRGCIGVTEPKAALIDTVARMARAAAREDPRFLPVQPGEVSDLTIEISLLGPPEAVTDAKEIEVGTHGLVIERGAQRGLLLPQVPVEWGWDREQFLDQTCVKAGLPPGCWRRDARIYAFTAEVFAEED